MQTLLAIANASAGSSDDESVEVAVASLRKTYEVELVTTSTPEELDDALAAHPDLHGVVVLGGDGSLHAVIAALRTAGRLSSVIVGLIPLGTGNDFAATLGLPDEPDLAAEVIVANHIETIDLIIDGNDEVVVNVAHIGVGAEAAIVARPIKKFLGPVGYAVGAAIASVKGLATPGADLAITIDGDAAFPRGRVIQLAVGNGRFVGGGAALLPEADPSDGLIDLMVTYAGRRHRRIAYAWKLRTGDQHEHDDVIYRQGTSVTVVGDPLPCTSDGELTEPAAEHSWRIEPGAIRMWR
ncbi:YegS/Rv2252/BmrU family lipid kinase [Aeromicrobium panaciterrae]|uniref:YegS/Rv2252/BmrU family lipid kinase n=1 Tax=Aeromicrobium panaciterrae TaxID=363861 RepID=A0ABU1UKV1_9ACTN|nr:diacylglycerol kinase family protein [Aeromicrobium panaciterrae]MDR7085796.1 YegS/Rv2252/BmrU family lipid kinase [Aeromicrobium panaciterrae]